MNQNQEKKSLQCIINQIHKKINLFECTGLTGSDRAWFISQIYTAHKIPVFVILPSSKAIDTFSEDLGFFLKASAGSVKYFTPYNILPFNALSYHNETAANRIRLLYQLTADETPPIVLTTVEALLQKLIPKQELFQYAELIMPGEDTDRDALVQKLVAGGYARSLIVEEPGDFCVRGGILDIFSPLWPDPLRIEFFGDTVDSLRFFSAATQRTLREVPEAVILPAREAIIKPEDMEEIIGRIKEQAFSAGLSLEKLADIINRIRNEGTFPGIESLISLIYPKLDTFFDYAPRQSLFVLLEPDQLEAAALASQEQTELNYQTACDEDLLCVEPSDLYLTWSEAKERLLQQKPLSLKMLPITTRSQAPAWERTCAQSSSFAFPSSGLETSVTHPLSVHFSVETNAAIRTELKSSKEKESLIQPLANWINDKTARGYTAVLDCSSRTLGERLKTILAPYRIQPGFFDYFPDVNRGKGRVFISAGHLSSGFVWPAESLAVLTEEEIFGVRSKKRKIPQKKVQTELLTYEDLKKGDLIVHTEHGIGQYEGLVKLKLEDITNDFLLILYKDNDRLYLPVDRMSMVQKYMGVEGIMPVLDKMGGKSWERVKSKVKKSVEKMAGELLNIYAARKVRSGHAFGTVNGLFQDFEAGFPYEETPDQLKAIEDTLQDMQSPLPMDRLICGDVGYGKTEVALRASLLAVNDGKQAAVLVPTTVLAEQHFATFSERFEQYPVTIECLSRFRPLKAQREIIKGLKAGTVDIVIGTHRLLQKDVSFKDLGLVVLDEEQRFGVRHKEKLKKLRSTVDVLALTATPIPRTLHMSLMGIRDISIISTPPEQRHAIITYISELDDRLISEAIRKELNRKGQIFFVYNNISKIGEMAAHLKKLVPQVRLDIAHGRMDEDELEKVMFRFMNRETDMLVCTTIIESGLDVPSANTIFINRADKFGLAQIYQLRGRVGRGDEQAYAYLFIPNESALSKDARKRLKVLMEHSDLGSGFQIAMSDLRIRGGGTILGASQSGHIAAVGYDMFLKLMEEAVSELKGEPVTASLEPEINLNMSAFLSESYIPDIDQRLSAYRRLAKMKDLKEIAEFKAELIDRYGVLPPEGANLLLKIMLKVLAIKAGVKRLDVTENQLLLYFSEDHQKNPAGITDMILSDPERFQLTPAHVLKVSLSKRSGTLVQTKNVLKQIMQRVNN
jgi:transcription-repair coupling factor (superfamily II helicase)